MTETTRKILAEAIEGVLAVDHSCRNCKGTGIKPPADRTFWDYSTPPTRENCPCGICHGAGEVPEQIANLRDAWETTKSEGW